MDEWVAQANIEHLRKLLQTETDGAKRQMRSKLLAEEELKLAEAKRRKMKKKG